MTTGSMASLDVETEFSGLKTLAAFSVYES